MSGLALGLDGGGTRTRAAVAGLSGPARGRGQGGACNLAAVPPPDALAAALAAADAALLEAAAAHGDIAAVCAGVAGFSFPERRNVFHAGLQAAFPHAQVAVEPDYAVALAGATEGGPGVIVIAGTGSAACGENARGEQWKTGAYGYLLDDAGSGYGVGRAALAAVLRAGDGTGEPTTLTPRLLDALDLSSITDIVPGVYGGAISRVQIAGLSRVVAQSAREDSDAAARALLLRAGGALAHLARGVTQALFPNAAAPFPVSPIGGLWDAGGDLSDVFVRSLRRFAPAAVFTPPQLSPVDGALLHARKLLGES